MAKAIVVTIIGACYMASLFSFKTNRYLLAAVFFVIALTLALFARAVDNAGAQKSGEYHKEDHYE